MERIALFDQVGNRSECGVLENPRAFDEDSISEGANDEMGDRDSYTRTCVELWKEDDLVQDLYSKSYELLVIRWNRDCEIYGVQRGEGDYQVLGTWCMIT